VSLARLKEGRLRPGVVAAAAPELPPVLVDQLAPGGRMVLPLGDSEEQRLFFLRNTENGMHKEVIDPCRFVPLIGKDAWPK
jgi:protein-L-isoaspartate(D-aspartate) O-methyltransferase